ncbi:hypothetical protein NVP1154O_45 [Vibrio phage 1.154.O._10N.222.52.B12]|nr:hypothetical protein NVP1154O_45 [Vibrio phage 1.154.O._10N.222.52.B12]
MTLREYLETDAVIFVENINSMAIKCGIKFVYPDASICDVMGEREWHHLNVKSQMIIEIFRQKFGIDEEF